MVAYKFPLPSNPEGRLSLGSAHSEDTFRREIDLLDKASMNSKSPGQGSGLIEHDIEMNGLGNSHPEPQLENGGRDYHDDDDDDNDSVSDSLLGSPNHRGDFEGPRQIMSSVGELWPQIRNIVMESAPTLLFTTVGLLFTGKLLDRVSHWPAMTEVHQLIMIIPVILNLKGNLEMNLSARLGTAANVGELDDPVLRHSIISGNLSLLQVQAAVVSFIAAWIAIGMGLMLPPPTTSTEPVGSPSNTTTLTMQTMVERALLSPRRPIAIPKGTYSTFSFEKLIMVASSGMTAASLSSIVLGSFMCTLIVVCRRYGRDPDNIAPPIASCLGDLVTLLFMGFTTSILIAFIKTPIPFIVGIAIVAVAVLCFITTVRNPHVRPLLSQGWAPLFGAMIISSGTGMVLDRFASRYEGFALLAVVISGLPGSVGSILISRLSTSLHAASFTFASGPPQTSRRKNPSGTSTQLVMMTLLLITLPIEVCFLTVLRSLGWLHLPFIFIAFSIAFFFLAVMISLFIAQQLTMFLWSKNLDPDMYALPIHSALMDLVGQLLLAMCFEIVQVFVDVKIPSH